MLDRIPVYLFKNYGNAKEKMTKEPADMDKEPVSMEKELLQGIKENSGKLTRDLLIVQNRLYTQLESLSWLQRRLAIKGHLPQLRGWAASPDVLLRLHAHIIATRPQVIVEFGSGVSTLVIADALCQNGVGELISIEHSEHYGAQTLSTLQAERLEDWVDLRICDLEAWEGEHLNPDDADNPSQWYSLSVLEDVKQVDLIWVDGPPGITCLFSRYPALPALADKLSPNAEVWMDDTIRQEEKDICERWANVYGFDVEFLSLEKGLGRLTRPGAKKTLYSEPTLRQQVSRLEERLLVASKTHEQMRAEFDELSAKYRVANAKYRELSHKLSALKSSQTYKAGLYVKKASGSVIDAVKLPVRLWRLKMPKKNLPKQRMNLQQYLRKVKWKVVVPLATRFGVPYSKVAYLSYPQSMKVLIGGVKQQNQKRGGESAQSETFTPPSSAAQEISILGWPEYPPNDKPYVIGIMDEFTSGCFEQEVNLIQPRPDNWYALAEKYRPALFFIESAWRGNHGSWQYRVADYSNKPGQEVAHICQYAREKGIPTLFWNKEDPVHHDKFMCSAKLVDHIFTTDANMKASYQAKTGNQNVHALPFAAQPGLHKPAPLAGRKPRSCFAGSWYGNRHAERGQAMKWLLQAANKHGLDIYDRNHGTGLFPFPEEYQAGIKGSLPYKELCNEYSRYRVFLNVNSVTDSPTMFARRVFELMACGTPVVSTYAKGIENLFESDAVWMVHSQEEADEAIRTLMTDDTEWRRRSLAGIREVFAKHTYAHRLNDIFVQMGIEHRLPTDPQMLLMADAHGQAELEALDHFAKKQSYRAFRLGITCPPGIATLADSLSEQILLLQPGEKDAWVTEQQAEHPIAGWITPHSHYGEHYLRDLANASIYEPDAAGWAKALGQDRFAYGEPAVLCSALWKTAEFLKHYLNTSPEVSVTHANLYLADSDQFQPVDVAHKQVAGG
ncbi:glycosyltransferase [Halomonas sp. TRM85114]|uniref:glycosyltransferase family protein n=1 Tax=Halomonas jincaotanensis TaxID=2810616 RepID=UPI001BD241C0|nr:glycosyltransferase [Halomonas jincaotanensis]MBS9402914.1 glycosyltransferase [Halomonas jincaotanensis]